MDTITAEEFYCITCGDTGEVEHGSRQGDGWVEPPGVDLCDCQITDQDIPF